MNFRPYYYLAYGSNLNLPQMAFRCKNAKPMFAIELSGWKVVFRGVADIIPTGNPEDKLHAGIWEITEECERRLDIYEGFPSLYRKIKLENDQFDKPIMAYVMNSNNFSRPSASYYQSIHDGYEAWGMDLTLLQRAANEVGGIAPPATYRTLPAASKTTSVGSKSQTDEQYKEWQEFYNEVFGAEDNLDNPNDNRYYIPPNK